MWSELSKLWRAKQGLRSLALSKAFLPSLIAALRSKLRFVALDRHRCPRKELAHLFNPFLWGRWWKAPTCAKWEEGVGHPRALPARAEGDGCGLPLHSSERLPALSGGELRESWDR